MTVAPESTRSPRSQRGRRWTTGFLLSYLLLPYLLLCSAEGLLGARSAAAQPAAAERPNVLWIIAEDLSPDLGVSGTPQARTPRLDRLAEEGMRFTRAFTPSPVCSPSRSALMTGVYPQVIGAQDHRSHRPGDPSPHPWPLPDSIQLLTDWMRQAGYFTANVQHFPDGIRAAGAPLRGSGKTDWNFTYAGMPFDTKRWSDLEENQPFFAQVNFYETHRGGAWEDAQETVDRPADPDRVELPPYYPDHPVVRRQWAEYLNTLSVLDEKVGAVLDLLEKEGLDENTVVVFMSDHGRAMVRAKQWPYDSGLRVPLLVRWPDGLDAPAGYRNGAVTDRLVSTLDVTATTMAFGDVPRPQQKTQGRVLFGPQKGPPRLWVFGGRDRGDETVDRMRTVRSRRFRYIRNFHPERPYLQTNRYKQARYPTLWAMKKLHAEGELNGVQTRFLAEERPEEELYDLAKDPHETTNLADSSAYQAILEQMRGRLDQWLRRIGDTDPAPVDSAVVRHYREKMQRLFGERVEQRRERWDLPANE